jgi:hypothetical protein
MKFFGGIIRLMTAPALISTALCVFGPAYVVAKSISLEDQDKVKTVGAPTRFVESGFATGVSKLLELPIVGAVRFGLGPLKDLESAVLGDKHYAKPTLSQPTYHDLKPFDLEKYAEFLRNEYSIKTSKDAESNTTTGPSPHVKVNEYEQLCPTGRTPPSA